MSSERSDHWFHRFVPWLVLIVSLGLTFLAYDFGNAYIRHNDEASLRQQSEFLEQRLVDHVKNYEQILISLAGLFEASETVSQEQWNVFIQTLKVQERYPGYWAISYSPLVRKAEKEAFEQAMQQGGSKDFMIKMESTQAELYPLTFLSSPTDITHMLGVDLGAEPIRRQTIEQARDSGDALLTPPLTLFYDNENRTSMILVLPVFRKGLPLFTVEQRRSAFQGVLATPIILSELIGQALSKALRPNQLTILDSENFSRPVFRFPAKSQESTELFFEHNSTIDLINRTWIFHWKMPTLGDSATQSANLIMGFGLVVSFLAYGIVHFLISNRRVAMKIADRTTQQLRDASSLQQAILDGVRYAIVSVDEDGFVRHFNRTAELEFGYRAGEMIGVLGLDFLFETKEMEERALEISEARGRNITAGLRLLVELDRDEKTIHQDWTCVRKDGSRFPLQLSVATLRDDDEKITGYAIIGLNISAQKTAEHIKSTRLSITETLARSETSHGALPTVLSILGAKLGFDACAFWSYSEETEFFKKDYQWAHDNVSYKGHDDIDRSSLYINDRNLGLTQARRPLSFSPRRDENFPLEMFQSVFVVPLQCGEEFRGCCSLYSLGDRGSDQALVETLHEIGLLLGQFQKRLSAEQALRESEERFKAFMENSPVLAYIKNEEGRVVYVNEHGAKTFNRRSYEILDNRLQDLLPSSIYEPVLAAEAKAWSDNRSVSELCQVTDEKGRESFWMMFHFILKAQSGKRFLGAISIDVSDQKRIEIEIQTAWKLAEEANIAKSEFLANVSHEVRTPMNGIIGMAELLVRTQLLPEQRDYLNMMMFSADSLLGIVNDILDFSKIDAGKLTLETIAFNLQDVIGGAVRPLYPRAYEKGVQFLIDYEADLPSRYLGDPLRLSQVVINLLSNAIKFTSAGRVILTVRSLGYNEKEGAETIRFAVDDTGIGISKDKLSLIFEAFSQADGSTSRNYGGSGLGLTISSHLVQMMGSRIEVSSELDKGSLFYFDIELPVTEGDQAEGQDAGDLIASGVAFLGDSAESGRLLARTLKTLGMHPLPLDHLASAVSELRAYHEDAGKDGPACDAVVVDLGLGYTACFEFLKQLRSDPQLKELKIIVIVTEISQLSIALCREFEVDDQLLKPLLPRDIKTALQGQKNLPKAFQYSARELQQVSVGTDLKVLLVEDNVINQTLALRLLERKGCRVVLAKNGNEAVAMASHETFDLILMDIQMPGKGGVEATQDIRRDTINRETYMVAMTAHAMQGDRDRFLAAGLDSYLSKPIRVEDLFTMIDDVAARIGRKDKGRQYIDIQKFLGSIGGDQELLQELSQKFLENAPQTFSLLEQAIVAGNAADIEMWAHKLKGSFSILAAEHAAKLCQSLEDMGEGGDLAKADESMKALAALFPMVVDELRLHMHLPSAA